MVIKGLYESLGLFAKCRRDLDGLVKDKWANSVDVPKNPQLVVRSTGAALGSADRKKSKDDMGTVNVPFQKRIIQLEEEYESRAETNGEALSAFTTDVTRAFERDFNNLCMNEALASAVLAGGANLVDTTGSELIENDLSRIKSFFINQEVPNEDQIVIIPANLADQFKAIPMIRNAMSYNKDLLEKGVAIVDNILYLVSAKLDQVGGKDALCGFYSKGIAFVIKKYLDREEVWDTVNTTRYVDYLAYVAVKLTRTQYSIAMVQQ